MAKSNELILLNKCVAVSIDGIFIEKIKPAHMRVRPISDKINEGNPECPNNKKREILFMREL